MKNLFDFEMPQASPEYLALRDETYNTHLKNLAQEMWCIFSDWADSTFPQQFAYNVHPRFWEMYLGVRLLDLKFQLIPKQSSFGPDFHVVLDGKNLWIEATAPTEGSGNDAVPSLYEHSGIDPVPEDKIILRFTNAIAEKVKQREDYIQKEVVSRRDPYVIAVNGHGIGMNLLEGPQPNILKSVYPVGDYSFTIDVNTLETVRKGYQTRFQILKRSGAPVPTNAFLDPIYSGISGILYSNVALWAMPIIPGCEYLFIHNALADIPLEIGWLGTGKDCYKEGNNLTIVTHSKCT
jgi:hypothetical protein